MAYYTVRIPKEYTKNERLDKYIASIPSGMNRSKLKSGVVSILVNGKNSKLSCKVKAGDCIDTVQLSSAQADTQNVKHNTTATRIATAFFMMKMSPSYFNVIHYSFIWLEIVLIISS